MKFDLMANPHKQIATLTWLGIDTDGIKQMKELCASQLSPSLSAGMEWQTSPYCSTYCFCRVAEGIKMSHLRGDFPLYCL